LEPKPQKKRNARLTKAIAVYLKMSAGKPQPETVEYRVGKEGYQDVGSYDACRYAGSANQYKQRVMANAYKKLIGPLAGKRILDVGCGTGRGVIDFGCEAAFAAGSDASLDMLRFAAGKSRQGSQCAFVAAHAQRLPFPNGTFDVITALNFLHLFTLDTQQEMVAEMKRVAKPGGALVLEFDNALHGLGLGLYKRWSGVERGSLPREIGYVIGDGCRVASIYGAVFPVAWRVFSRFPRVFAPLEKIAYILPFRLLSHRVYYKLFKRV
jgi:ubiquinone/menaquinone biosynthesis C-methylase UbiE